MKNATKIFALALVLTFGASIAKAEGIIIGDRAGSGCIQSEDYGILLSDREGIIIGDRGTGIAFGIVTAIKGLIDGESTTKDTPCAQKEGIIIGDREGIIIGD